jgi:hypothetical protein
MKIAVPFKREMFYIPSSQRGIHTSAARILDLGQKPYMRDL